MKSIAHAGIYADAFVAPFVGAWIEIAQIPEELTIDLVAPFVGAWIEISSCSNCGGLFPVAPFVGAWIEILQMQRT